MFALTVAALLSASPSLLDRPLAPPSLWVSDGLPSPAFSTRLMLTEGGGSEAKPLSGWHIAGVWAGASNGGSFGAFAYSVAALATTVHSPSGAQYNCSGSICAVSYVAGLGLGMIAGGLLGYRLGALANDGHLWAKILVISLDVLGLPTTAFLSAMAVAATGNVPGAG